MTDDYVNIEELKKYAKLEGSEYGEALRDLCSLANYANYLSEDFEKAVKKEIKNQIKYFKKNTKIVTNTRTETYEYEELDWLNY